jgi:hypothetical protein
MKELLAAGDEMYEHMTIDIYYQGIDPQAQIQLTRLRLPDPDVGLRPQRFDFSFGCYYYRVSKAWTSTLIPFAIPGGRGVIIHGMAFLCLLASVERVPTDIQFTVSHRFWLVRPDIHCRPCRSFPCFHALLSTGC